MKFGKVDNPDLVDFSIPQDHADTNGVLNATEQKGLKTAYVGCAKWNRKDLKGFYPRGTKDELMYYSTQFNSIELNATFYRLPPEQQVATWRDKTPDGFKFFPKVTNTISHLKRLNDIDLITDEYCANISAFKEKLGMVFLQLHDNFKPQNFDRLANFVNRFPVDMPLAIELRNTEWFNNEEVYDQLYQLMREKKVASIIVDAAGRRDLLHMRLTSPVAFVRYVGANHASDYTRLNHWVERIKQWSDQGLEQLYFFVHQNVEKESPALAAHFVEQLNEKLGLNLHVPTVPYRDTLKL